MSRTVRRPDVSEEFARLGRRCSKADLLEVLADLAQAAAEINGRVNLPLPQGTDPLAFGIGWLNERRHGQGRRRVRRYRQARLAGTS